MPDEINLEIFNADPITEDLANETTEAAPKTYALRPAGDAAAESQADLSAEMKAIGEAYAQALKAGAPAETQPRLDYAPYRSSVLRHPTKSLHHADPETNELYSPASGTWMSTRSSRTSPSCTTASRSANGSWSPAA